MKKRLVTFLAAGVAATSIGVMSINDTASAATPREGAACVRNGVKFLATNGLLIKALQQKVDYSTIDSSPGTTDGLINTTFPGPTFLPLSEVIKLHYTSPELFDWCGKR